MNLFDTDSFSYLDKKTKKILMESRESFIPHTPYIYEKNMLAAVCKGDIREAEECLHLMNRTGKAGLLSENPLRQEQILFISFITQITRAAMDMGVPEDLAYAMSDSYIQTSEACTKIHQITLLQKRALRDFTAAVKHQKDSPPFSKATRAAIQYMHSHLQEKITLGHLAHAASLSPGRFSHLFREETGLSPMAFLQKEKMETAKTMLLYTRYPVSEISTILGYSSESHFIRIFQKYMGTSPGKYRKENGTVS